MTYSFTPLADIPVSHDGLFLMCVLTAFVVACVAMDAYDKLATFVVALVPAALVILFSYCVSYVWTDQTPKTFANTQVIGTFVGYESEGYKERSGKSYVDRHYTYVIYKVDGGNVMLPCVVGKTYPERAILYKN